MELSGEISFGNKKHWAMDMQSIAQLLGQTHGDTSALSASHSIHNSHTVNPATEPTLDQQFSSSTTAANLSSAANMSSSTSAPDFSTSFSASRTMNASQTNYVPSSPLSTSTLGTSFSASQGTSNYTSKAVIDALRALQDKNTLLKSEKTELLVCVTITFWYCVDSSSHFCLCRNTCLNSKPSGFDNVPNWS